ncbi:DUF72 domain-containing protein [Aestuariibacter sp. GS-14]|uniref:DUF72 domain-containing protein n=1 Tax=Aestuariibacter sp. GS-14 TaxID=2590670 RepID=UPI0021023E46|nr:DUF72 domain-containing protein [Aestuariibacter sp. GS-14]
MTNIQTPEILPTVMIGLPQWQHGRWPATWFGHTSGSSLSRYARQLNSVEGNTTFYHLPAAETVAGWYKATPDHFRFTFKFHQGISHQGRLSHNISEAAQQLSLLSALEHKLGIVMLQLPASFGPSALPELDRFLAALPSAFHYAVEVRHLAFFAKGEAEKALNRCLIKYRANRVIMDTRALFSGNADCELTAEVRTKKPKVPVNVIATSDQPVIRFVGNNNHSDNMRCLMPWITKCHEWRLAGKTCYLFFHRPDNQDAPWLAQQFIQQYNARFAAYALPELTFNPTQTESPQSSLF